MIVTSEQASTIPVSILDKQNAAKNELSPTTALDKLNLSRARIYQNMRENLHSKNANQKQKSGGASVHWFDSLKSMPGGAVLMHAVNIWWSKQPLRAVAAASVNAVKIIILPIAQRHPFALVIGAFALGSTVVWSQPWRWVSKPIVLSGLLAPLLSKVISNMPTGIWAEAFSSLMSQAQGSPSDPP